jgi:hypothetical protein
MLGGMSFRSVVRDVAIHLISPRRWLRDRLAELEVEPSSVDPQEIDRKLPWHELDMVGREIKPPVPHRKADPFYYLGPIVDDELSYSLSEQVDIRNIYGICASKSHIVPLASLGQTRSVNDILAKRDVQKLIREVLHGTIDYVAYEGDPVKVVRQAWDGRLYVVNSGGSHRFAAIWRWHREHERPLMMDCIISTAQLSKVTLNAVAKRRYWLMRLPDILEAIQILNAAGDRHLFSQHNRLDGIPVRFLGTLEATDCCVAYPREHPMADVVDAWLELSPALDLSAYILGLSRSARQGSNLG